MGGIIYGFYEHQKNLVAFGTVIIVSENGKDLTGLSEEQV